MSSAVGDIRPAWQRPELTYARQSKRRKNDREVFDFSPQLGLPRVKQGVAGHKYIPKVGKIKNYTKGFNPFTTGTEKSVGPSIINQALMNMRPGGLQAFGVDLEPGRIHEVYHATVPARLLDGGVVRVVADAIGLAQPEARPPNYAGDAVHGDTKQVIPEAGVGGRDAKPVSIEDLSSADLATAPVIENDAAVGGNLQIEEEYKVTGVGGRDNKERDETVAKRVHMIQQIKAEDAKVAPPNLLRRDPLRERVRQDTRNLDLLNDIKTSGADADNIDRGIAIALGLEAFDHTEDEAINYARRNMLLASGAEAKRIEQILRGVNAASADAKMNVVGFDDVGLTNDEVKEKYGDVGITTKRQLMRVIQEQLLEFGKIDGAPANAAQREAVFQGMDPSVYGGSELTKQALALGGLPRFTTDRAAGQPLAGDIVRDGQEGLILEVLEGTQDYKRNAGAAEDPGLRNDSWGAINDIKNSDSQGIAEPARRALRTRVQEISVEGLQGLKRLGISAAALEGKRNANADIKSSLGGPRSTVETLPMRFMNRFAEQAWGGEAGMVGENDGGR